MPSPETTMHLDEGTAHAWLDDALAPEEAARVAAHVAGCAACRALVAEARGLVAGASRVLAALDDVPGGVVPASVVPAPMVPIAPAPAARAVRRTPWELRVAAGLLLAAGLGSAGWWATAGSRGERPSAARADDPARLEVAAAPSAGITDSAATASRASRPADAAARGGQGAAAGSAAAAPTRPRADVQTARRAEPPREARALAEQATVARAPSDDAGATADAAPPSIATAAPSAPPPPLPAASAPAAAPAVAAEGGTGVVRGVVTTADGRPIVGADVRVEGSVRGAVSDSAGRFVIGDVAPGDVRLRARVIGYAPSVAHVAVAAGDTSRASLSLAPSTLSLQEVTVTGSAARSERRVRRTGAARSATPVVGCWAVNGGTDAGGATRGALPARLRLRDDGRALAGGAPVDAGPTRAPGRWTLGDDGALRVRWDERFTFELRAGDDGAWTGTAHRAGAPAVRVTLDADAGCTP